MADIPALQAFAAANFVGQTAPLSSGQVRRLAGHWLPELRFYREEHFFPVAIEQVIEQVESEFASMSSAEREGVRMTKAVRDGDSSRLVTLDPPVLFEDADFSRVNPDGSITWVLVDRVLASGAGLAAALDDAAVDGDARLSHGADFDRSNVFFGPTATLAGGPTSDPDRPFRPRLDPMTVIATFVSLPEALRYELLVQEDDNYPPDGMRGGIDIAGEFFDFLGPGLNWPDDVVRQLLIGLLDAYLAGEQAFRDALDDLPFGLSFNKDAWDALTRYVFIEYDLFYAYNDFDRYQTTPFENEHEGDDEGFCLVFERNAIEAAAASGNELILLSVTPHSIVTLVHEELHGGDLHQFLPAGTSRDDLHLTVWIAAGSHATYLSSGTHDLVDFQDTYSTVTDALDFLPGIAQLLGLLAGLLTSLVDAFVDTEDFTSDDGVHGGPQDLAGNDPTFVRTRVQVLPMSAQGDLYEPAQRDRLVHRAFAGHWGGHDGTIDKSPTFKVKTGRYFRNLRDAL